MHRPLAVASLTILILSQARCAPPGVQESDAGDDRSEELESGLSACVADVGHWNFWGACAEDVPLGPSTSVHAFSSGQVVKVYPSCGGFAGQSVRVESSSGRAMYGHIDAAVVQGQWLDAGDLVGTVHGGAGPVYCDASLTACGVGKSASRPTLCWSGPHLHREGACCGQAQPSGVLLVNQHSERCAEILSYSKTNGASAVQWGCHGESNQRWEYVDGGGGEHELRNVHSGKCLEVLGWSAEDGAAIGQWQCHGGANQRWQAVDIGDGLHELRNVHSGKCLEVYGWSTSDQAPLAQWSCVGADNQRWWTSD